MSKMKDSALYDEADESPCLTLDEIAEVLGGRVVDDKVVIGAVTVTFSDPARPESFWVYGCGANLWKTKKLIRAKLNLPEESREEGWKRTEEAMRIWDDSVKAEGTLVEAYLRRRGITVPVPSCIKFYPRLWHHESGCKLPAMVALVVDHRGASAGIHQTWLSWAGTKANVSPNKKTRGVIGGCAVRLSPTGDELVIGEGIETSMSAMVAGRAGWSAMNAVNLGKLILPKQVRSVVILVDGDRSGEMGAAAAYSRWVGEGRRVVLRRAPPGKDFNDILTEGG
jgi:hypothetical protein